MKIDEKHLRATIQMLMKCEAGKAISDADRAYKRGWRDALRSIRAHLKDGCAYVQKQSSAASNGGKDGTS